MFNKILEHRTTSRTIRGIGSNRMDDLTRRNAKVIRQRIMSIQSGSESGRRSETLFTGEVSVYDERTKDYIESNRLLDFASNFCGRLRRRPTDLYRSTGNDIGK